MDSVVPTLPPPSSPRRRGGLRGVRRRSRSEQPAATQTGAALFPQLVWAHYRWEQKLHGPDGLASKELESDYQEKLRDFQKEEGRVEQVYWSTKSASAVAMTARPGATVRNDPLHLSDRNDTVHFHRVTDWVTRDAPLVGEVLYECDLLASKVEQVLLGTSQRIAMRSILAIAMHLLGFLERDFGDADRRPEERRFAQAQRRKLADVESYYHRAACEAGRIVYVSGMLIGLLIIALIGVLSAWLLSLTDISGHHRKVVLLCYGAGAAGALVSTIARMGKPEAGKFNVDFELGRPLIRRLGVFRPFVGGIFGVAMFFLLASGLLDLKPSTTAEPYYFGIAAFLAGFSERFATGIISGAEHRLAGGDAPARAAPAADDGDDEPI